MRTLTLTPDEAEEPGAIQQESGGKAIAPAGSLGAVGRFQLCSEIASGGMGKVFLARAVGPSGFEKFVALKRIHAQLAEDPAFVDMFLDEARINARIDHPNVCSVIDFGRKSGTYYIVMEYLSGEPLHRVIVESLREAPDHARRSRFAARIVAEACEGLHAAHELRDDDGRPLGVVHRDISPHNIFVTFGGRVKVMDFGIARASDQLHKTTTGTVKGKWAYMSPEQANGKRTDRRSDVWSLGVVLWEMLAGRRLFRRGTQPATALAVVNDPIEHPVNFAADVPRELGDIALRALARDPLERWPDARTMGRALTSQLAVARRATGAVEVAQWIGALFPGGDERRQDLLAAARERSEAGASQDEGAPATVERSELTASPQTVNVRPPATLPTEARREPRTATPKRKRAAWLVAPLAVATLAAVAAFWVVGDGDGDEHPAAPEPVADNIPWIDPSASSAADIDLPVPDLPVPDSPVPDLPVPDSPEADSPEADTPDAPPRPQEAAQAQTRRAARTHGRPRPARRAHPVGEGRLNVLVNGGYAEVYIDGRHVNGTPTVVRLSAGRHRVELRYDGHAPGERVTVEIEADATTRLVRRAP